MKKGDVQLGAPQTLFIDSEANVVTFADEGMFAYANDLEQIGYRDASGWQWLQTETIADARYVLKAGDAMTGGLSITDTGLTAGYLLDVLPTYTDIASTVAGERITTVFNPTADNAQQISGLDITLDLQGAFQKTGNKRALYLHPTVSGSGNTNNMRGIQIDAVFSGGGVTTQNIGVLIQPPSISGGSTITNSYGLYIAAQGNAGITGGENIGIYVADVTGSGSTMHSIFTNLGLVRFGDGLFIDGSTDRIQLLVQGNATQTNPLVTFETSAGTDLLIVGGTGAVSITPTAQVVALKLTNPGTPTVNSFETYDSPGSFTGGISYDGRFGFSNVSAQAGPASDIGGKVYYRANLANVYGFAAYGYLLDTTTGNRAVTGIYVEGEVHSGQTQSAGGATGIQVISGNLAPITLNTSKGIGILINNSNASAVTTSAYGLQVQINSNTGTITNLYGLRVGNVANADFASGTVTNAYGLYINPIDATTLSYGIYVNTPTATTARSIFTAGGIVELTGSTASQGLRLTTTGLGLDNGERIFWKTTGGSYTTVFLLDGSDQVKTRAAGANGIVWATSGDVSLASLTEAGTFTIRNATASTGVTRFNVRAGAGQSTTDLSQWQNSSATSLTRVASDGTIEINIGSSIQNKTYDIKVNGYQSDAGAGTKRIIQVDGVLAASTSQSGTYRQIEQITSISGTSNFTDAIYGNWDQLNFNGTGTITKAVHYGSWFNFNTAATITEAVHFEVVVPSYTAGTITTLYGLRIADLTNGATNYAIQTNAGLVVFNEGGHASADIRWESDTETHMLFGDANGSTDGEIYIGGQTNALMVKKGGLVSLLGTASIETDVKLSVVGKGLYLKEGSNATMGVATLVGGTVTVNTTKVTANSRIFLTIQSLGTVAVPMAIGVTARTAGTSFTITSTDGTDTSVIAWMIVEPA